MTAQNQNIEHWSGDDAIQPFQIVDELGQPENLQTYTAFTFTVRDKAGGTVLFTKTLAGAGIVVDDLAGGELHIIFATGDTSGATVVGRFQDYVHELEGLKAGKYKTLAEGRFRLHKSVAGAGA